MTNAILTDLQTRILANTLSAAQRNALADALDVVNPLFPSTDEISNAVPGINMQEIGEAWVAPLFALVAQGGGASVDPRSVGSWFVSTATGNDGNPGTSADQPLKTFAALSSIWRGAQPGGGRPTMTPTSGTLVVEVLGDHDLADPLAPILDIDLAAGADMLIFGGVTIVSTGTIATVTNFARTSAGGQIAFTDTAVPNFQSSIGLLFQDFTADCVAFVVAPDGTASATAKLSRPYTLQSAGTFGAPTPVQPAVGDAYQLERPFLCALGDGFTTRSFPEGAGSTGTSVTFYRLELRQNDDAAPNAWSNCSGVSFLAQECSLVNPVNTASNAGLVLLNSICFHGALSASNGGAVEALFGGGVLEGSVNALPGSSVIADDDFAIFTSGAFVCSGGQMTLGAVGRFGAAGPALQVASGTCLMAPVLGASTILYGTTGATCVDVDASLANGATLLYTSDASGTPAGDVFKLSNGNLTIGLGANAYGFNDTTGLFVGPTTTTIAHLDAALAAGTGFGGNAIDPQSGAAMRIA